ncbi:integral membrane protein [Streptomyces noursei]|uniref:Membrane protein n=2 Tax=Streptomyces noursei TaxID=1971 RepID=A0A059W6N2_STRNR|nr:integral membrane protein [Streptomyces noursei]GCB91085.1 membrane protein [Streptomyces noursei]
MPAGGTSQQATSTGPDRPRSPSIDIAHAVGAGAARGGTGERGQGMRGPRAARGWLRRVRLPRSRRAQRRAFQVVVALTVLALLPATWLNASAGPRVRTVADVPAAPVAVVFGAGLWNGEPSPYLAHRLDAAVRLYRDGTVRAVLVTGDNSRHDYDEPDAMRGYLVGHGVPDRKIVSDFAGFDTWDSCTRAHRIFGVDRAVLVSQGFHIRRALALCHAAGIDAYGVGVAANHDVTWAYGGVREILAAGKATAEAVLRPDPHFLGPKERGLAAALR